jgi:hypothetical protein
MEHNDVDKVGPDISIRFFEASSARTCSLIRHLE